MGSKTTLGQVEQDHQALQKEKEDLEANMSSLTAEDKELKNTLDEKTNQVLQTNITLSEHGVEWGEARRALT